MIKIREEKNKNGKKPKIRERKENWKTKGEEQKEN